MFNTNALLEALPVAVYTTDGDGRITFYNHAAAELWGYRPELGSMWCGSWRIYWPDGTHMPHDQCPMAIALKEGRIVRGVQAVAERPDGTRVAFEPFPTPFRDEAGRIVGGINVLVDVSKRTEDEAVAERLAAIVASSDDAIISKTLDGKITSWNAAATRIFGYEADEMIGQHITRIIPAELHAEEVEIIARLRRGERIDHYETVRVRKDGRRLDISLTVSPLRNRAGTVVGASKVARDITEKKQSEKLKQLLIEELNHRVKNTLATVQAIATQSLARAKTHKEFVTAFSGRMQALAKVHTLLTQTTMQGTDLRDLVTIQARLGSTDEDRVTASGPFLFLGAQDAGHLGMVLHELATNARKYGALSTAGGRVSVSWELRSDAKRCLVLEWTETGGPKVRAPETRGFGMTLIEQTVRVHGGEASMHFAEDGLRCRIEWSVPDEPGPGISAATLRFGESSLLPAPATPSLHGKTLLIVEDEPLVAMEMQSILGSAGCTVLGPVGTVREALKMIAATDCDAALVDVNLKAEPVDKLLRALQRKGVPYGFVTGYGAKVLSQAFEETVTLTKPFSGEQLLAVCEVLLYLRGAADVVPLKTRSRTI